MCMGYHARYDTDLLHIECKIPKLESRRVCHLTNFLFYRAHDPKYIRVVDRQLRRFYAPIMTDIVANNNSFCKSILYQGALHWNRLPVDERNIQGYKTFKRVQKAKLVNWKIPRYSKFIYLCLLPIVLLLYM